MYRTLRHSALKHHRMRCHSPKFFVSPLFLLLTGRFLLVVATASEGPHHLEKRAVLFPQYSVLQFTYGVSAPAILPSRTINLSLAVQCNFDLPYNLTNFMPITYYARSENDADIDRNTLYQYIVNILNGLNLNGEECLFRAICEVAHVPFHVDDENTLLEKIAHFVLTPSIDYKGDLKVMDSRLLRNATYDFEERLLEAEMIGRVYGRCTRYFPGCELSIVDLISAQYKMY